jgi:hypothetical protein
VTTRERFGEVASPHDLAAWLLEDLLFGAIAAAQRAEEFIETLEDRPGEDPGWDLSAAAGDKGEVKYLGSGRPPG